MPHLEQPGQGGADFGGPPIKPKIDFWKYSSDDRQLLASKISKLLNEGKSLSSLTEEELQFYIWQKER